MTVHRDNQWPTVREQVRTAVERAVRRSAIKLQRAIKNELSKPGTGRFYARHAKTRALSMGEARHFELSKETVASIVLKDADRVLNRLEQGKKSKILNLRQLGIHRASAPGRPPAIYSGLLRKSIQFDPSTLNQRNPRLRVGTNLNYAPGLEYGTSHVARRPYMRVTARRMRGEIAKEFANKKLFEGIVLR